jgi:nucleoid DNA-binding protein
MEVFVTKEEQPEQQDQRRVSKRSFLAQVSASSNIPQKVVNRVYDTIVDELLETMRRGDALMLTGFGKFHPQAHKGHRVQFADHGAKPIDDYFVLKFSATRSVNKSLLEAPREERDEINALFSSDVDDEDFADFEEAAAPTRAVRKRKKATPALTTAASATKAVRTPKKAQAPSEPVPTELRAI